MAKLTITGSTQPIVGNTEAYSLSVFDNLRSSNPFSFPPPKIQWNIYVQDKKGWRITHGNTKEGEYITYKFTHKSLKYKALKIEVIRGKDKGELYIKPQQAEEPKILRVDLLDINSQLLKKGKLLHYTDTLIAKAHCVGMFGHKVSFTLWEDDAIGKGHDPVINMMNRINPVPLIGEVDHEGVAKVVFRLPGYTMAVQIANAHVARGDENEGKTHEYYVTAEMVSKHIVKASPNVNVANPSHIPEPSGKQESKETDPVHKKFPSVPPNKEARPDKPKPKPETPKFPQTPAARKQTDPEGKILGAEFTDGTGKPLRSTKTGDTVSIKISSQNMRGKNVKVRIWEEDFSRYSNDLVYEVSVKLAYNTTNFINGVNLTKDMYAKSNDWGEGNEREYFIEVEHLNTSVTSKVIPVSSKAEPVKVDVNDSVAVIKEKKQEKTGNCICQEQYKDLIWGGKVSCEFRKKVVQIAKRLEKDPNLLMAGMALETGRTFSPTAGKGKNYVGLIQFGDSAAESVGTTRAALLKMTAIQQLDYVEKYLAKKKDKINTLTDFYLSILMPVDVGKGNQPNHIVFDNQYPLAYNKNGKLTDLSKSRHYGYRQNPSFLYEGKIHKNIKVEKSSGKVQVFKELYDEMKIWYENGENKYDGEGKTYIWEIEKNISKFYEEGKLNTVKKFECEKEKSETKPILDKGTWNIIITEHYTGNKCAHLEKTKVRVNCRRGKISVYNHNQEVVLTIKDCLLEGIAGEDHMKTNADVPFGEFQINESTPFYSSDKKNRESYGPHPRLVFEPIYGNNDEAAKSKRSAIRIHGGRQEGYEIKQLKRTQGCIRVWDSDAKALHDWWVGYKKSNPNIKPGKVTIKK